MTWGFVGKSVVVFGLAVLVATTVLSFGVHTFMVDIGSPIVVVLGIGVVRKSAKCAKWGIAVVACYAIMAVCLIVIAGMGVHALLEGPRLALGPEEVLPIERSLLFLEKPWAVVSFALAGVWAAANVVLLALLIRRARATPPPPPPGVPPAAAGLPPTG